MNVERKKVEFEIMGWESNFYPYDNKSVFLTTIKSTTPIHHCNLELTIDVEVPDSLKEFRENKGLSKEELVEWLNKNYK